jgi:hypothetical protein
MERLMSMTMKMTRKVNLQLLKKRANPLSVKTMTKLNFSTKPTTNQGPSHLPKTQMLVPHVMKK